MIPMIQPTRKTCGQTCLAMIAECTVEEACKATGRTKRQGTTTLQVARGLQHFGIVFKSGLKIHRSGKPLPNRAILRINHDGHSGWHWVLLWDGDFFDPSPKCPCDMPTCKANCDPNKATSYLELFMSKGTGRAVCVQCSRSTPVRVYWDSLPWGLKWKAEPGQKCERCGSLLDSAAIVQAHGFSGAGTLPTTETVEKEK